MLKTGSIQKRFLITSKNDAALDYLEKALELGYDYQEGIGGGRALGGAAGDEAVPGGDEEVFFVLTKSRLHPQGIIRQINHQNVEFGGL